ncbi:MAG: hypothetical protein RO469_00525 [Thermincola sp.]|nr:hypothetical protein [Thermincola sp.]MDT3701465.1 hypothetical protein [Thermincola sp.]
MKEVMTKFLLITVAVVSIVLFVYGTLWDDVKAVKDDTHLQITDANSGSLD